MAEQQISTEQSQASKHADNSHASVSVVKVTDQSYKFSTSEFNVIKLYDLQSSVKEKINASTKRDTEFYDIAEPYDVLKELNVQVTPQLEEIDFYGGDTIPDQHDYAPMSVALCKLLHYQRSSQQKIRQKVELSQILNNFDEGQICFVGPAGSGKTTLLKAISRDVMEGKYENLKIIEIVQFVKCRGFRATDKVTPAELLFRNVNPELNKYEMNESLEFAKYNSNKILFVIDSLDTLPYALDGEHDVIGLCEEASPATILWNLLTNKLLPGCRSITSSREHTIRKYEGDLRANKVIALAGLTEESMKQIIAGYLDEIEAEEIMSYLRSHHSLLSLCETPVFLVFTLIGWKYVSEFTPRTMSGILVLLLQSLQRSSHANAENMEDVINKMKELAFTGTKEGRVLFQIHELAQYDLEEKEVTDIAVLAPGKSGRRQRLLEGDSVLFFCHQSIQETLTAFHIAEMELDEFKTFIAYHLHTPHYCVVRRILCGIMLDENVTKAAGQLLKENDFQVKKSQLLESLRGKLWQFGFQGGADELLISLYEAGDGVKDIIASSVKAIYLGGHPLLLSDVHAVGFIMHHCTRLQTVKLSGCSLTSSSIQVLASSIKNSNVKISNLDLSMNPLDATAMSSIGRIVKQCQVDSLILFDCKLSSEGLENFKSSVGESKISDLTFDVTSYDTAAITLTLDIVQQCQVDVLKAQTMDGSHMNFFRKKSKLQRIRVDATAMSRIGLFIKQCQVDSLILFDCKLSSEGLENFKCSAEESKISKLNLSWNPLDATAMSSIGRIVKQCQVDSLILRNCKLSSEVLENFKSSVVESKISVLDLTNAMFIYSNKMYNDFSDPRAVNSLISLLPNVTKELKLPRSNIPEEHRQLLQHELDKLHPTKLKIFGYYWRDQHKWILEQNVGFNDDDDDDNYSTSSSEFDYSIYDKPAVKRKSGSESYEEVCKVLESSNTGKLYFEEIEFTSQCMMKIRDAIAEKKFANIEFDSCHFPEQILSDWLKYDWKSIQINTFRLHGCIFHEVINAQALLHVIKKWKVETLDMSKCQMMLKEAAKTLENGLQDSAVTKFLYNYNMNMTSSDVKAISRLLQNHHFKVVEIMECNLTHDLLRHIVDSTQVNELNLSFNKDFASPGCLETVGSVSSKFNVQKLFLCGCSITKSNLKTLSKSLTDSKLRSIDLSENKQLCDDVDMKILAEFVISHGVKELSLAECDLDQDKLKKLHSAFSESQVELDSLNIQSNMMMEEEAFEVIGKIVKDCRLKSLNVSDCQLTEEKLDTLVESLRSNRAKIEELDISEQGFILSRRIVIKAVQLLDYVETKLYLCYRKIGENNRKGLQRALDLKKDANLKIFLDFKGEKRKRLGASDESNEESENKRKRFDEDIERHPSPGSEIEEMKSDEDIYSTTSSSSSGSFSAQVLLRGEEDDSCQSSDSEELEYDKDVNSTTSSDDSIYEPQKSKSSASEEDVGHHSTDDLDVKDEKSLLSRKSEISLSGENQKRPGASDERKRFDEDIERPFSPGSEIEEMKYDEDIYSTTSSSSYESFYDQVSVPATPETKALEEVKQILKKIYCILMFEKIAFTIPCMEAITEAINSKKQLDQLQFIDCQFADNILATWRTKELWDNIKITGLNIRGSIIHGNVNAKAILHAVKEWKVEELDLSCIKLELNNGNVLQNGLQNSSVKKLIYKYNSNATMDEISNILKLLQGKDKLEVLELVQCNITKEHLNLLVEDLACTEIMECDLSHNSQINFTSENLSRFVKQSRITRLSLCGCRVTDDALKDIAGVKFENLNLSENFELVESKMENLGLVVGSMNIEELSLAYCELDDKKVKQLYEALKGCKFKTLDVQENSAMGDIAYKYLGKIVNCCGLQMLNISECQLTKSKIEALIKSFQEENVKLAKLYMNQPRFTLTRQFTHEVVNLLPFITEQLHLCYRKTGTTNRQTLRKKLKETKNKNLKIVLDFKEDVLRANN